MFSFGGGTSKKSSSATNEDVALVHALLVMGLQDAVRRTIQVSLSARERRIRGERARGEEELVDSMTEVEALLEVLELCLWHGLREPQRRSHGRSRGRHDKTQAGVGTSSTAESSHFWDFVLLLERVDPTAFGGTIMLVRANSGCSTNQGLCRAWIRMLLNQNALEYTIRALCRLATTSGRDFYEDWAFLRWSAETNRTMFFNLLGVLNNVGFALNTKNRGLDRPSPVGPRDMLSHDALKCCLAFESALAAACAANPNDPPTVLVASSADPEVTGRFVYLQPGLFSNRNTGYQLRMVEAKQGTSPRQWGLFAPAQDQPRYLANATSVSDPPLQDWAPSDEVAAELNKPPQAVKMLHSQSVRARLYPGSHKIKWGTLLRSEIQAIRVEIKQVEHLRKRLDAVRKIECPMGEDEEDLPPVQPLETVVEEISQSDSPQDSDSSAHVRVTETTPNDEATLVDSLASGVNRENCAQHADAQNQMEGESKLTNQARHEDLEVHTKENLKASLAADETASLPGQDDHAEQVPKVTGDGLSPVESRDAQQDERNRDVFTAMDQHETESQNEAPRERLDADTDNIEDSESAPEFDIGLASESERIVAERNSDAHEPERSVFDFQNGAEKVSVSDDSNAKQEEKQKVVISNKDGNEDERDEPIIGAADQLDPSILSSDAAQNEELLDVNKTTDEAFTHATPSMDQSDLGGSTEVARPARCVSDEIEVDHNAAYEDTDASVEKDGTNKNSHKTEVSDDISIVQDAGILSDTSKEETVSSGNAALDDVESMENNADSESGALLAGKQDSVAPVEKDGANKNSHKTELSDDISIAQDAGILSDTSKEETVSSGNAALDDLESMEKDADSESGALLAGKQDSVAPVEKDGANEISHKTELSDDISIAQDAGILSNTSKEETVSSGMAVLDDARSMENNADSESGTLLGDQRVSDVDRMTRSLNPFEDESVDSPGEGELEIAESDVIESSDTDRATAQDTETLSNKIDDDVAVSMRAAFDDCDDANSKMKVSEVGVSNESKSEGDALENSIEGIGDAADLHVVEGHHAGAKIESLDTLKTNNCHQLKSFSEVSSNFEAGNAEVSFSQSSEADSVSVDVEVNSEVEAAKPLTSKGKGRKGPRRVQMASIEDNDFPQDPLQALEPAPSSRGSRQISRPTVVHASKIAEAGDLAKSSNAIQFNSTLLSGTNNFVVMQGDDEDDDVEIAEMHGHASCDEVSLETGVAGEVDREKDGLRTRDLSASTAPSGESEEERLARYAREEEESLAAFIAEQNAEKAKSVSSKREAASHASRNDEPPANVSTVPTSEFVDLVRAYVRLDPQEAAARTLASKIHASTGYEIGPMRSSSQDINSDADEVTEANSEAPVATSSKFSLAVFSGRLSLWGSGTDAEQGNDSDPRSGADAASSALETGAEDRETSDLAQETDSEIDIDLASDANVTRVESASVVGQYISKRASDMHVRYIIRVQLRKIARAGNDGVEEWTSSENDASILQERTEVDTEEASSHVAGRTATYTVHRRFRDFKQLRTALFNAAAASSDQDSKESFPTLPKTAWTRSFSEDYIARKRIGLDDFLQEILRLRFEGASAREHPIVIDFLTQGMCVPWEEDEEERGPDFPLDSPSQNRRGSGLRRKGSRGLHVALITDPRGDPQVMEERDSIGLAEQDFRCMSCGRDISIALGESKGLWGASREASRRSARFCHYTEGWFCPWCFSCGSAGDREQEREFEYYNESDTGLDWDEGSSTSRLAPLRKHHRVLPTRVLHHWDFEPLAVSADAAAFLDSISQHPVLCVSAESPRLFSQVKELQHARLLRLQLVYARETLARCIEKDNSLEGIAPALRSREHLAQETEMYSMNDLFELHLGTLIPLLMRAVDQVSDHITKSCELCRSTAQTCAVCDKKDDPLFAFDIDKVVLCRGCQGAFHRECFVSIGGEEFCPICKKSALNS